MEPHGMDKLKWNHGHDWLNPLWDDWESLINALYVWLVMVDHVGCMLVLSACLYWVNACVECMLWWCFMLYYLCGCEWGRTWWWIPRGWERSMEAWSLQGELPGKINVYANDLWRHEPYEGSCRERSMYMQLMSTIDVCSLNDCHSGMINLCVCVAILEWLRVES